MSEMSPCVRRSKCAVKSSDESDSGGGIGSKNYIILIKSFSVAVLMGGRLLEFSKNL
jgi:hypothetical protein